MPVKIENLANRPVLLRLNSGQTLHLAPRETLKEIMYVEVKSNAKIQKLQERGIIALHRVEEEKRPSRGPKREKAEPAGEEK